MTERSFKIDLASSPNLLGFQKILSTTCVTRANVPISAANLKKTVTVVDVGGLRLGKVIRKLNGQEDASSTSVTDLVAG